MNKFNLILCFVTSMVILGLTSCSDEVETIDAANFGYEFYPLATGKTWIFASDSIIIYNGGSRKDTVHSLIKEEVGDSFSDINGDTLYNLHRYFKRNETDEWQRINTWTTSKDKNRVVRTEENIRFIKMVFPVKSGLRFDANAFVDEDQKVQIAGELIEPYDNWNPRMEATDLEWQYKDAKVKSLFINLVDDSSIIDRRKVHEFYGHGIGLLKKEMIVLDLDGNRPNDPWQTKAQKGFIHTLTLIDHN